jgi:RHS repeat-associated protein
LFAIGLAVFAPPAFAQLAPSGEHYAGRPSDTGYGGTFVNATGSFAASIPLDLPAARGALPIPLQIVYGGEGVGAAGLGWDLPLSYIQQGGTLAHRRPPTNPGELPGLRNRTYISLLGQRAELLQDGNVWIARYGTLELSVIESAGSWLAYDGKGRTYTFAPATELDNRSLWLLRSISGPGEANVQLTYRIITYSLDGGVGYEIDLINIDYNTSTNAGCAKNEIALTYGNSGLNTLLSMSVLEDKILVRKNVLTSIDVNSRASCASPFERLRSYVFNYTRDTDTLLLRLSSAAMLGRQGTPEGSIALPVANYKYGSATSKDTDGNPQLRYQGSTQIIDLPSGISATSNGLLAISSTTNDSSISTPGQGSQYATWQSLIDINGDGRPDFIFEKNNQLWVAYSGPGPNGTTTLGAVGIAQLTDAVFSNGPFATQSSVQRRYSYDNLHRNTTDVWRKAIDVNGDGRIDIIDAGEELDHWVIYLNTPGGPTGVQWQRRSFSVTSLRAALEGGGHTLDGPYVPLSRRATGTDLQGWRCWINNGTGWQWWPSPRPPECPGDPSIVEIASGEKTYVEWDLIDLNGDGYPDFVFDSKPVDVQGFEPCPLPAGATGTINQHSLIQFSPGGCNLSNEVRASFNVVGVRFDTDRDAFSLPVILFAAAPEQGVALWECPGVGPPCDFQTQRAGFADVNGDGLVDRIVQALTPEFRGYLGAYSGTAVMFSQVYITLPGALAEQVNDHDKQCKIAHVPYTAAQTRGLRDLTGDGIPDYLEGANVWIGTGTGFRQPIPIASGVTFQFSHETETCDGNTSNNDGGLFDIDGDGKPEIVGVVNNGTTLIISQLAGGTTLGNPESGRLTEIDNGYGATTTISYDSAKRFTVNPVPFPEIVVSAVATTGMLNLGGNLAGTRYAYSNAELIYDSALDRFIFPGYRRTVVANLTGTVLDKGVEGTATITDTWPLTTPFDPTWTPQERWKRIQSTGRVRDIIKLRGPLDPSPWSMLDVDANDVRVIGGMHYEWGANLYQLPSSSTENIFDCMEMTQPLDFQATLGTAFGANALDVCRAHGFPFETLRQSWYGAAQPPADENIQTLTKTLVVDDFGNVTSIEYDNDLFRSDDDICVENTFAVPNGTFPRVLNALASRRFYTCGKSEPLGITVASESFSYDNLPPRSVASGLITSHSVDRRATDTGVVLNTIRKFDATYDADGNLATITTQRNGATRTLTFSYDPFGLVPVSVRRDATGVPTIEVANTYDSVSLKALSSGMLGQSQRGIDFDGFGRPIRFTVTPAGGALGVLSTASYFGFTSPDPDGRHITSTRYSEPVPQANVSTTKGRSATMFLDELGRERRTEINLGSDYANAVVVTKYRLYDDAGRVAFAADPFEQTQSPSTAYGTSFYFNDAGDLQCMIRGTGHQPLTMASDSANELFPTCFRRWFASHTQMFDASDAASLQAGSPQFGVVRREATTAVGRIIERSTLNGGCLTGSSPCSARLEHEALGYDHLGQLTSITRYLDPAGPTAPVQWSDQRDSLGQVLQITEPDVATRFFRYSDWGEPVETQWNDSGVSRSLVRTYDSLDRLTAREERNNGVTDPETVNRFSYDSGVSLSPLVTPTFVLGRLASATSPTGQVAFSYDPLGRVNAEVFTDDQGGLYVEKMDRNADGGLTHLEFDLPDQSYSSEVSTYGYDSAGRLRVVKYKNALEAIDLYEAEDLDPFGRVRKALMGGKTSFIANYANNGRRLMKEAVVASSAGSRQVFFGQFDPVGRELSRREYNTTTGTDLTTQVAYDPLGRLQRALKTQGSTAISDWQYAYDALGNVLHLSNGGYSVTLSYNATDRDRVCRIDHVVSLIRACNVSYNGIGDIVSEPTPSGPRTFSYFADGRTREITQGRAQATFGYDVFGGVRELNVTGTGGSTDRHVSRYGQLIERQDQTINGTAKSFISRNIPGPGGAIFASRRGTNDWVFQFGEQRGNRVVTNQNGAFVQDIDYQPFGDATSTGASAGDANYTAYQWNGGDALAPFGLARLGARVYDPVIGRFLSRDPYLFPSIAATTNPYAFASNDPVNRSDPSGLSAGSCIGLFLCISCCSGGDGGGDPWEGSGGSSWGGSGGGGWGGGGARPTPRPPSLSNLHPLPAPLFPGGPTTVEGVSYYFAALNRYGSDLPTNFNFDTYAATGATVSNLLDVLAQTPVIAHKIDAEIDARNARLDRWKGYSRGIAVVATGVVTGGLAAEIIVGAVAPAIVSGLVGTGTAGVVGAAADLTAGASLSAAGAVGAVEAESAAATDAASSLQGFRLSEQLAAEELAGARAPTSITSWSDHALEQIAGRDGVGVSQAALVDAFANPILIQYAPSAYGPTFRFIGNAATVVVNPEGRVVTGWATSSLGIGP